MYIYDDGTILRECDANLDVTQRLKALLEGAGATVMLTRSDDSYLTNGDRYTAANAWGADILVPVHTYSTCDSSYDGSHALCFHSDDKVLATAVQRATYAALDNALPEGATWIDFGTARYASGVLLKSDMSAAMAETLYISSPWEAGRLRATIADDGAGCRRAQIADAILQGIMGDQSLRAAGVARFQHGAECHRSAPCCCPRLHPTETRFDRHAGSRL